MKTVGIFGSTGSVGVQALEIAAGHPDRLQVTALSCGRNLALFRKQLAQFQPELAVTADAADATLLSREFPGTTFLYGEDGLAQAARTGNFQVMFNALLGIVGLRPTMEALRAGREIALANKESLVAGGAVVTQEAEKRGCRILPVDSEHSAVFQCLQGQAENPVSRIYLTASGGPFRGYSLDRLAAVTKTQALKHPRWNMGQKITVDSATLMNKGLEVIEARWLFDLTADQIDVVVHPQSIIHSMVMFEDRSILAQLGSPDMKIPISYALSWPARWETDAAPISFFELSALSFEAADTRTFICLKLAYEALRAGESYPVALNAANEVLVQLFLEDRIRFIDIQENLERILHVHQPVSVSDVDNILAVDRQVREITHRQLKTTAGRTEQRPIS